jgi:hypothetical protein
MQQLKTYKKIITVDYAREKLGKKAEQMTDQQINEIINTLTRLCNISINSIIKQNTGTRV